MKTVHSYPQSGAEFRPADLILRESEAFFMKEGKVHRLRDLADVQDLISVLALPLHLAEQLDESMRGEYRRLWQAVHQARENP